MNILHTVEFYPPSVGGMQEVVRQLSERLVRLGHVVTVATTKMSARQSTVQNGVKIVEFAIRGNLVHGMTGEVERYREFCKNADFDVITNFAAQQWATDAIITELNRINAKKVFVPTGFSGLYDSAYAGYFCSMKEWLKQYDANVFLSDDYRDINFAREHGITNHTLIPNGAAEDEFLRPAFLDIRAHLGIPEDSLLVLHIGSHTGDKGHAEAIKIFSQARLVNATFLMIGNNIAGGCAQTCQWKKWFFNRLPANRRAVRKMQIAALSRNETVAAFQTADLFLFPSNIECSPLVLFECMASKTPFLATDAGNAAEIVKWGEGGVVLPTMIDAKGFARADVGKSSNILAQLATDSIRRSTLAEQGHSAWRKRFTWEKISLEYERLYRQLAH